MSQQQSRRSFLGLITAVSAALASGVRLPGAEGSQAAETAPVQPWSDDEAVMLDAPPAAPPDRTPAGLLAMLRELLPQCVAVAWEQSFDAHGFETKVTYRSDSRQAALNRNPLGVDLAAVEGGRPVFVEMRETSPMDDLAHLGKYRKHEFLRVDRELVITWRSPK